MSIRLDKSDVLYYMDLIKLEMKTQKISQKELSLHA